MAGRRPISRLRFVLLALLPLLPPACGPADSARTPAVSPAASRPAAAGKDTAPAETFEELVGLLSSDSVQVREAATRKLIAMGLSVRPPVMALLQDKMLDAEARVRLLAVLDGIMPAFSGWPFDANEAARRREETARALGIAEEVVLDLGKGVSMKLVLIPAGEFVMGIPKARDFGLAAEAVQQKEKVRRPFYIGVYAVTQEQYEQVTGRNPSRFKGGLNPVETVSLEEVEEFLSALSGKTGRSLRLPAEAEWEYACRAGTATRFHYGDDPDYKDFDHYMWCWKNSGGKTHPVGLKQPNAWGLYDMHGNVWQWCRDLHQGGWVIARQGAPGAPDATPYRVCRGGSWGNNPEFCLSASQLGSTPYAGRSDTGFRVVADLK